MRYCKVFVTGVTALTLACSGSETSADFPDAVTADPAHYSVEFENDAVRLIRIAYGPGESSVMHHHPANCAIFLRTQPGTMETPDGQIAETEAAEVGSVNCSDVGETHLPTNAGSADMELVLVEFKGDGAGNDEMPDAPHAVAADPGHYSVEFENDAVRLVRVRYRAGEGSLMHHHPAYCAVTIEEQPMAFQLPDGSVEDSAGGGPETLNCVDSEIHSPTNNGDGELNAVLIEFKGRAAATE